MGIVDLCPEVFKAPVRRDIIHRVFIWQATAVFRPTPFCAQPSPSPECALCVLLCAEGWRAPRHCICEAPWRGKTLDAQDMEAEGLGCATAYAHGGGLQYQKGTSHG